MSVILPQFAQGAELDKAKVAQRRGYRWLGWVGVGLAALGLALVIGNVGLGAADGGLRTAVQRRQVFIAQTAALGRIDNALIIATARRAASGHDAALNAILKRAGVTYRVTPPAAKGDTP